MVDERSLWNVARGIIRKMGSNLKHQGMVKCKYCGSDDVVKFGTHKGIQRWWCKDRKRKFVNTEASINRQAVSDQTVFWSFSIPQTAIISAFISSSIVKSPKESLAHPGLNRRLPSTYWLKGT